MQKSEHVYHEKKLILCNFQSHLKLILLIKIVTLTVFYLESFGFDLVFSFQNFVKIQKNCFFFDDEQLFRFFNIIHNFKISIIESKLSF